MRASVKVGMVLTLAAVFACGCASSKTSEAQCEPAREGAAHAVAVNGACPIMPEDSTEHSTTLVEYKGQQVAFCCPGCVPKWNSMTDAQRDAALAKVVAAK